MEIGVNAFHVSQDNLLLQYHFIECADKECIEEASVENGQADHSSNKPKIVKMFRVDSRVRVYLEGVIVMGRILKQAIERVEHFVREQEEELSIYLLAMRKGPRRKDPIP